MARRHLEKRRARRNAALIAATVLLASLCAPAALLAQDAAPVAEPVTDPDAGSGAANPAPPPAADAPVEPQPEADPPQPGDSNVAPPPTAAPPTASPPAAPTPAAVPSGGTTVTMADFSFSPATVTVNAGDTVTWTNAGPAEPHTATGDGFDTGEVAVGSSGSATFAEAGTFSYVCSLHPDLMSGTVEALAAGGGGESTEPGTDAVAPDSEAAAVAAPDAAGTAAKLPSTGFPMLPLALTGIALLGVGVRLRRRTT